MQMNTEHQMKVDQELNEAIFAYKEKYSQEERQEPKFMSIEVDEEEKEE